MKRSPSLVALSREHHTALVWAKRAQRGGSSDPKTLVTQLAAVFDREMEPHFQTEERGLLPALRACGQNDLVDRTLADHRSLRNEVARIRAGCTDAVEAFGRLLGAHVRFEERELFPVAEVLLFSAAATGAEKDEPRMSV